MSFINDIKSSYKSATIVEKIIYINVLIYIFTLFAGHFIEQWFSLKSIFSVFVTQPWTLVSYAFIHGNFPHILFNSILLYYIGNLFLNFFTEKQFLNYYFLGIIAGGIAFFALQTNGQLVGASAGCMAIIVGLATKIPTYEMRFNLIGGVKLWVIAAFYILVSISGLSGGNIGGNIAHLGGALLGFIYSKQLQNGLDIGKFFENIMGFFTNLFKQNKQKPLRTVHKKNNINRKPTHKESKVHQNKIDDILDKISKSGYESLSKEEKDFLFKAGK